MAPTHESQRQGQRPYHKQPVQSLVTSFKVTSEMLWVTRAGHSELEGKARRRENTKFSVWWFGNDNECKGLLLSPLRGIERGDEATPMGTWWPQRESGLT